MFLSQREGMIKTGLNSVLKGKNRGGDGWWGRLRPQFWHNLQGTMPSPSRVTKACRAFVLILRPAHRVFLR